MIKKNSIIKNTVLFCVLLGLLYFIAPGWFMNNDYVITTTATNDDSNLEEAINLKMPAISRSTTSQHAVLDSSTYSPITGYKRINYTENNINKVSAIFVGSFESIIEAQIMQDSLVAKNMPAFIKRQTVSSKNNFLSFSEKKKYVVFVGPEIDNEVINNYMQQIKVLGLAAKVTEFDITESNE